MKIHFNNEKAFTLIEMLLVLSILLMISSIIFQFSIKITEKRAIDQFFNQVQFDFQQMQAYAIETDSTINFIFLNNSYKAQFDFFNVIFVRNFPPGVQFESYSNKNNIIFTGNGEVLNFGKARFYTSIGERELIINIHKGRIKYVEL